jgi:hypothetical protein
MYPMTWPAGQGSRLNSYIPLKHTRRRVGLSTLYPVPSTLPETLRLVSGVSRHPPVSSSVRPSSRYGTNDTSVWGLGLRGKGCALPVWLHSEGTLGRMGPPSRLRHCLARSLAEPERRIRGLAASCVCTAGCAAPSWFALSPLVHHLAESIAGASGHGIEPGFA